MSSTISTLDCMFSLLYSKLLVTDIWFNDWACIDLSSLRLLVASVSIRVVKPDCTFSSAFRKTFDSFAADSSTD